MTSDRTAPSVLADTASVIDRAAHSIALSSGLTGITLRRVASVSGMSPAEIAKREPSMTALAARTFADLAGAEYRRLSGAMAEAPTPLDALQIVVTSLLVTDNSLSKTIWADAWSIGRHNDFVAAAARTQMVLWQETLVAVFRAGTAAGQFRVSNPGLAARQFFALLDSTTAYGLVGYLDEHERVELVTRSVEVSIGLPEGTLAL